MKHIGATHWCLSLLTQIKDRNYPRVLEELGTGYLSVGITYNSRTKEHACFIEKQKLL